MNRAERRKQAKLNRKNGVSNNRFAINFKYNIMEEDDYKFNLFCVYNQNVINDVENVNYDNDKCFDIINENISNLFVLKAGNADMSNPKVKNVIDQNMRNIALSVLRMVYLDPYKNVALSMNDNVIEMDLTEVDGNIGFNLLDDTNSLFMVQKGIQNRINNAQQDGVDAVVEVA